MKFFDFELYPDSFQVRHIFDAMNKKMFVNLLVNDYRLMLDFPGTNLSEFLIDEQTGKKVKKPDNHREYYFYDPVSLLPDKIIKYATFRKIIDLSFTDYLDQIPYKIKIQHQNIKFNMYMNFIK